MTTSIATDTVRTSASDTPKVVPVKRAIAAWLLAKVRDRFPDGPLEVVEVGVKQGYLAEQLLEQDAHVSLLGVDRWIPAHPSTPYAQAGDPAGNASLDEHLAWWQETRERVASAADRCMLWRADSPGAAKEVSPSQRHLVFLDADHTYDARLADLRAWEPTVCSGGVIAGGLWFSKFGGDGCARAVRAFLAERQWDAAVTFGPHSTWAFYKPIAAIGGKGDE